MPNKWCVLFYWLLVCLDIHGELLPKTKKRLTFQAPQPSIRGNLGGWAKGAVASPFSVKYFFKRFLSKINAGINMVGNCTSPISEYSGLPPLFLQKESRGLKNHVVMKLIVDHSPLLSNVSCCVLLGVFLFPEKNYYYPLWLPSIKASRAVSESLLALVFSIEQWAIRKPCHFRTNNSIC